DQVVADSRAALLVEESRHDPVWYFPPEHVDQRMLIPTQTTTYCPFKGYASHYTIDAAGGQLEDAAWSYQAPFDECRALAGYIAFYADRVRIEAEGEPQRPT